MSSIANIFRSSFPHCLSLSSSCRQGLHHALQVLHTKHFSHVFVLLQKRLRLVPSNPRVSQSLLGIHALSWVNYKTALYLISLAQQLTSMKFMKSSSASQNRESFTVKLRTPAFEGSRLTLLLINSFWGVKNYLRFLQVDIISRGGIPMRILINSSSSFSS